MNCPHCEHNDVGVELFRYVGIGDWICNYCGCLVNPQFPARRATQDDWKVEGRLENMKTAAFSHTAEYQVQWREQNKGG